MDNTEKAVATRTIGEQGQKFIQLASDLSKSISETWNDDAIARINADGAKLVQMANDLATETAEDYEKLNNFYHDITAYLKTGETYCEPFKKLAKNPHNLICDVAKKFSDPGQEARTILNNKITEYRKLQRKRQEEAERKAEYERQQAEKKKREAEEKKAEKALDKGNEEKADMHLENAEAVYVPPAVVVPTVKKTETTDKGKMSFVKYHEVTPKDEMAILKAVASGELPATFFDFNDGAVKKWAKACGVKDYNKNGLVITEEERPVSRRNFNKG